MTNLMPACSRIIGELEEAVPASTDKILAIMKDIPLDADHRQQWMDLNDAILIIRRQKIMIDHLVAVLGTEQTTSAMYQRLANL
jgi:hypothetical protein